MPIIFTDSASSKESQQLLNTQLLTFKFSATEVNKKKYEESLDFKSYIA